MTNIWGFLIQTIEISLFAVILLIIKRILKDKLSPRWQYGIWLLFIVCMIIPAGYFGYYIFPMLNVWIETLKTMIEQNLQSNYIQAYDLIYNTTFIPYFLDQPKSITDFLFVIYVAGVYIYIIKYILSYIYIKKILKNAKHPDKDVYQQVQRISNQYHCPKCSIVTIPSLPSAFIFGIIKPILVLPSQKIDDKVILHELLHLKFKDPLQNIIWSLLKSFHWCNPFLHFVFQQINNDMESLCDQRVLELIEGEERRDYGRILLSMTNEKYPHAFGTSSLSNGGKNIKARIEAIARFKVYPKGMTLVSICIGILLFPVALSGTTFKQYIELNTNDPKSFSYQLSYASARMIRCRTLAGAIDLYAKGLLTNNELYLTTVIPQNDQNHYRTILDQRAKDIYSNGSPYLYQVVNLKQINKNLYEAYLFFENVENEYNEENEIDEYFSNYTIIPIQIIKEKGWKVKQTDQMITGRTLKKEYNIIDIPQLPVIKKFQEKVKYGQLDITVKNTCIVNNHFDSDTVFGDHQFLLTPQFDAQFDEKLDIVSMEYKSDTALKEEKSIGIEIDDLQAMDEEGEFCLNKEDIDDSMIGVGVKSEGQGRCISFSFRKILAGNKIDIDLIHETNQSKGYSIKIWEGNKVIDEKRIEVGE